MQAARGAVKDLREKGKSFVKPKYADQLLGSGLEEQIRRATAKTLPGPDLASNRRIVESINTDLNQYSAHQLATVLKGRLTLKNAHKQWLALELVQEILEGCPKVIEPARGDILEEVANIAAQPMNRYGSDLPGQQHCKNASFALLKKYGGEGQDAMREAVGLGSVTRFDKDDVPDFSRLGQNRNEPYSSKYDAYNSRSEPHSNRDSHREGSNADNSFSAVREKVQMGIATSHSHTEMLQDIVLNLSEGANRRDAENDKNVLRDLVKEMVTFRNKFEGTLEALSQFETREAQVLMTEALEAMDTMNNAIILQNEVLTARKSKSFRRSTSSGSAGGDGSAVRLAPPPGQGGASAAAPPQQQQQAPPAAVQPPQQPSYLDAFTELQQAMDAVHMSSGPTTPHQADPFASSYMHPSGQNSQPQRQDSFGNQSSAQPSHGQTPFGQQQSDQSSFGQPSFGQPSHGQASFGQAPNGQPSYDQPQFHLSSAGQPPFGQSAVGQPSPYVQAGQMPQQQASGSGPSASHNPFAAGFGGSSFGNSGSSSGGYPGTSNQPFSRSLSAGGASNSSYQPHNYSGPQQPGFRTGQADQAADPFDHLPYPYLGLTRPSKPERAPAPPLASLGANRKQQAAQQAQPTMQSASAPQQAQQGQSNANGFGGNIWSQPEASQKQPAAAAYDFGENAFNAPQAVAPQQSPVKPKENAGGSQEVPRPRNLYINSLYNAEEGAADDQVPPGFDPAQQALTRGTGSWGLSSPVSSPNKEGGYMGGSGPPTPEGLQYPHQHSAGSSQATTPAQSADNSEWDMFFANRVQNNGKGLAQPQQQQQQEPSASMPDAFDELIHTHSR